jgi:hypothetical protein
MSRFLFAASLALGFVITGPAAFAQRNVAVPAGATAPTALSAAVTHVAMKNDVIGANAPRHVALVTLPDSASAGM